MFFPCHFCILGKGDFKRLTHFIDQLASCKETNNFNYKALKVTCFLSEFIRLNIFFFLRVSNGIEHKLKTTLDGPIKRITLIQNMVRQSEW